MADAITIANIFSTGHWSCPKVLDEDGKWLAVTDAYITFSFILQAIGDDFEWELNLFLILLVTVDK